MQAVWVTIACNNACVFCPQSEARSGDAGSFFAAPEVAQRIREAAHRGSVVALVGGEPTIRPDLPALIRLARAEGAPAVVVQTNGRRLAYAAYTRELAAAGATAVDVSLHGPTAAIHDFHTRSEGSFAQTLTGVGVARGAGLLVGVTCALTRSNFRHAAELVRLAAARGAKAVQLGPARQLEGAPALPPWVTPSDELLRPHLAEAARAARSLGLAALIDGRASHPSLSALFAGPGLARPPLAP